MSQGNEFQVALPSNVPGPSTNTPGAYETTLARPLDLPGTWEVALIDITYPHTWLDLDKEVVVGISTVFNANNAEENYDVIGETNSLDLVKALRHVGSYYIVDEYIQARNRFRNSWYVRPVKKRVDFKVKKTFGITPNKYKLRQLLDKLQKEIRDLGDGLENTTVSYNKDIDRVSITGNQKKLLISSYSTNSLLPMLGFANQIMKNKQAMEQRETCEMENGSLACVPLTRDEQAYLDGPDFTSIDFIIIERGGSLEASLPPKLNRLNEIFVYTDIVDTVLIGNTQVPILGYFPIQSKWGDQAYWNFNPPYYVPVKGNNIRNIAIKLCDKTGETINFESGDVICRLHFRRIGMMRGFI